MLFQVKKIKHKKKKGISEMIGYILLVTIGIAMSILVYTWLKGYVPNESVECSDGVSLFVKSYTYNCTEKTLILELKNNGRFSLSGYLIHATTTPTQELATEDLSGFCASCYNLSEEIKFSGGLSGADTNSFPPSSENTEQTQTHIFNLSKSGMHADFTQIYSVEIVPTRYETINQKDKLATCTNAKIKQDIVCNG